jgi:thiamine-phosphate pyrophosphorylase
MGAGLAERTIAALPFRLLVVVDRDFLGVRWLDTVAATSAAAQGQPVAVQVRARQLAGDDFVRAAAEARACAAPGVLLILNGPAAVASRLGYDGVHWPEAAIPAEPPQSAPALCSAAVHGVEALERAERAGAGLVVFGAVYPPGSKPGIAAGLDALRAVAARARVPVFAIGGVTPERAAACRAAGASGVATISGVVGTGDPAAAIRAYLQALTQDEHQVG